MSSRDIASQSMATTLRRAQSSSWTTPHASWPHQVTRYQKWVPRLHVNASQLGFFILRNHDVWSPKIAKDVALNTPTHFSLLISTGNV